MTDASNAVREEPPSPLPPEDPQAQMTRARARGTTNTATQSVRQAIEVARSRWGTPVAGVAPPDEVRTGVEHTIDLTEMGLTHAPGSRCDCGGQHKTVLYPGPERRTGLGAFSGVNSWGRWEPPVRLVWADYRAAGREAAAFSPAAWPFFWIFVGLPGFTLHYVLRQAADQSARALRFLGLLAAIGIFVAGLFATGAI